MLNLTDRQKNIINLVDNNSSKIIKILLPNIDELYEYLTYKDILKVINNELNLEIKYANFMRVIKLYNDKKNNDFVEKSSTQKIVVTTPRKEDNEDDKIAPKEPIKDKSVSDILNEEISYKSDLADLV